MSNDTLQRFSNRVDNYIKYRPHYPDVLIRFLTDEDCLNQQSVVADIGSGTGILSELFLKNGNKVFAVEPNKEMREAAERFFSGNKNFVSIAAVAENTTLPDKSVNIITAGQAFHWFDRKKCKIEFKRILKEGGIVALIWNDRRTDSSPFLVAYENLLRKYGTDYSEVDHKNIGMEQLNEFFGGKECAFKSFNNYQYFNFEGLKGRVLSSSYMPAEEHPGFMPMIDALKQIFDKYNIYGKVTVEYDTKVYFGHLE